MIRHHHRLPAHPYRTPAAWLWEPALEPLPPQTPRPWWHARMAFAVLCLLAYLSGCAGTRDYVVATGNAVAQASDLAGDVIVIQYCRASMRAIGRDGVWTEGHCRARGPDAERPATDAELLELNRVRANWRPIITAHEVVARTHNALVSILEAADAVDRNALLLALSHVVNAYEELMRAAAPLGLDLPRIAGDR